MSICVGYLKGFVSHSKKKMNITYSLITPLHSNFRFVFIVGLYLLFEMNI